MISINKGMYYEDFQVGDVLETVPRTITEADIVAFAGLTGDYNQLHTDETFARQSKFGVRIAHGLLGQSIGFGLITRTGILEGTALAFLEIGTKFTGPIKINDTVKSRVTVLNKKETKNPKAGIVELGTEVINVQGEVLQKGEAIIMIARRESL